MPALIISVARTVGIYLPLAIVANMLWGYLGIIVATAVTNVVAGMVAWGWNKQSVRQLTAQ